MAYAGQTSENPLSGERITFRQTAADTNGELLAIDLELSPDPAFTSSTFGGFGLCGRGRRSR
jgi:hypothetical protein